MKLRLIAFAFAMLALCLAAADSQPEALKLSEDEQAVLELTNAERKKEDLPALKPSPKLFAAARGHSRNMAAQEKLAHDLDDKTFADRIMDTDYRFKAGGENVAWNDATPKEVVAAWMNSPPHKANILSKDFTEIGIGMAKSAKGEPYWTQVFADPR